jgi:phosphocarrier protein HPr
VKTCTVPILNPLGLHARAAARFVQAATGYSSRIRVQRAGREADGKSIMGLLLLLASQGTLITITADGSDEGPALEGLCGLIARRFDEAPCA